MTDTSLPGSSKVVIIGGGIVGCSTAYHLAALGCETLLLEQNELTSGSTWHAAGLVGQLRSSANITQLLGYSVELYKRLEQETGLATGWKMNGGLRLACNQDRWEEVRRQATTARSFGLDMQLLSANEAQGLWPLMTIDDVVGAAFLPSDGQANPADITRALARGARQSGAVIREGVTVEGLFVENGRIRSVLTSTGKIDCEKVVCCAGQWTREFAQRVGVTVPLVSVQHQYIVTEAINGVTPDLPTLRDPDRLGYYKEEVGGLVMGGYEPNPMPWAVDGIPDGFHYSLLDSDFNHFEPMLALALGRVPALEDTGIKQLLNGPESFTPDGNFILGESPELDNFFVGAGFNAYGIAAGGGAGMALAEWVNSGHPPYDLWVVDIRRFGQTHSDTDWVRNRTLEAYSRHYTLAWPAEEFDSVREHRRSPLYDQLKAQGACFGEKLGWERPNWFADKRLGESAKDVYSFGKPNWFEAVAREHQAVRQSAVLIDQSSFAKFILRGPGAVDALAWIAAGHTDCEIGQIVYTQMLDDQGGIQCDVTIARRAIDEFYIVTGTGFVTRDFNWISKTIPSSLQVELLDVTNLYSVLSLMGPKSREVLSAVTTSDCSASAMPFASSTPIEIAGSTVHAMRISYVGELGWELHLPIDAAALVYQQLMQAGVEHGLRNAGYRCIESCRLEKGYRAWGSDIGPDHTPLEAGLGWALRLVNDGKPYRGMTAIASQKQRGLTKMLATFTVDDPDTVLLGRETIFRNGEQVGWLSSGGYAHHLQQSVGMGYVRNEQGVDADYVLSGQYQLEIATARVPCRVHLKPLYDPDMRSMKS